MPIYTTHFRRLIPSTFLILTVPVGAVTWIARISLELDFGSGYQLATWSLTRAAAHSPEPALHILRIPPTLPPAEAALAPSSLPHVLWL